MRDAVSVELPFVYEARCVGRRRRTVHHRQVREDAAFDLPVVGPADVVPAFRVVRNDAYASRVEEAKAPPRENVGDMMRKAQGLPALPPRAMSGPDVDVVSAWEGRLYSPMGQSRRETIDVVALSEGVKAKHHRHVLSMHAGLQSSDLPVLPALQGRSYERDEALRLGTLVDSLASVASSSGATFVHGSMFADPLSRSAPARVVGDDRDERLKEAAAFYAESLLVSDGVVWTTGKGGEPFWGVWRDDHARRVRVAVMGDARSSRGDPSLSPFRADRRDDALDFAREAAEALGYDLQVTADELFVDAPCLVLTDDVVTLAACALACVGRLEGRAQEGWPAALVVSLEALGRHRLVAAADRDRNWAVSVLDEVDVVEREVPGLHEGLGPVVEDLSWTARRRALERGSLDADDASSLWAMATP